MSAGWETALLTPITADQPCGESLEDTELLASFDTYRLFGQSRPLDAPAEPDEKRIPKPPESPEWVTIRDQALSALARTKDLRLLAHLGTAVLRTDGVGAFAQALDVAAQWLETWWNETYPRVDEDAILRRNALNCFADAMGVVDGLRRVPLVRSRQHGIFSLRDIDIATRQLAAGDGDRAVDENQVRAAFGSMPLAELDELLQRVIGAGASLKKIDAKMREAAGSDATPAFDALAAQFTRMAQALRAQLASHPEGAALAVTANEAAGGPAQPLTGAVLSRQDAMRALDAVADFFRRSEPSSPVPWFCERAKRLAVAKDFFEVLADVVPDAVAQAKSAAGVKQSE
jgi:type VI secretion system protein ImpA